MHTHTHPHGHGFDVAQWSAEMDACRERLTAPVEDGGLGVPPSEILGFRAPYLEYNPAALVAAEEAGFAYDSSIEEGFQPPRGRPQLRLALSARRGQPRGPLPGPGARAGRRRLPPGAVGDPGLRVGGTARRALRRLRSRARSAASGSSERQARFDPASGKITGFDWNLWVEFAMDRRRVRGHGEAHPRPAPRRQPVPSRLRAAQRHLLHRLRRPAPQQGGGAVRPPSRRSSTYALAREPVRLVAARHLLSWLEDPRPLG